MFPVDYAIVGGGIAGLYCALKLSQNSPDKTIIILESDSELGGRIRTSPTKGFQIEKGAARFSETHETLMGLIKEFNLESEMLPIPREKSFVYKNKPIRYDLGAKLQDVLKKGKAMDAKLLRKITIFQLCAMLYGSEEASKIQALFGYDAEFIRLNAEAALTMFETDLFGDSQYYVLKCGFSELVKRMSETLSQNTNVEIRLGCEVTDIKDRRLTYKVGNQEHKVTCLNTILTTPYLSLRKFTLFKDVSEIQAVKPIALCRIYAKYPLVNGKPWFHDIHKTTTDNYLRYVIPMNEKDGIVMYYSDLYCADMWRNWSNVSDEKLIEMIHKELALVFPQKDIPKPTKIKCCHWKAGVHLWRPNYDFKKVSKSLVKPFPDKQIYLAGECYSTLQDWVEGALLSCDECLKALGEFSGKPNKTRKKLTKKR